MNDPSSYDNPWRPTYEAGACAAWMAAAVLVPIFGLYGVGRPVYHYAFAALCLMLAVVRGHQAWQSWMTKLALYGRSLPKISLAELKRIVAKHPDRIFLGYGWRWRPEHTQRLYELRGIEMKEMRPPAWLVKLNPGRMSFMSEDAMGESWIHGLNRSEEPIGYSTDANRLHRLVVGTTGSGKTRFYELDTIQACLRGSSVIVLDPKGDADLEKTLRRVAKTMGRPFVYFHPAFPSKSARFNLLKNWNRPTEVASRVASLLPAGGDSASFVSFAWKSMNSVVNGMLYTDELPDLRKLKSYVQNGAESLLERVLDAYLSKTFGPGKDAKIASKLAHRKEFPTRLHAMIGVYNAEGKEVGPNDVVEDLIALVEHNKEHYSKMILSLTPILSMLTSGALGDMLSPKVFDTEDTRPIWDTERVIDHKAVCYIGLDTLSDQTVGQALSSMILAELKAVAGARYNFGYDKGSGVALYLDEAGESVNNSTLQLLNKSRGSGFSVTLAVQTLSDLITKMGSSDAAEQLVGNMNNVIVLRIIDTATQDFVSKKFGMVPVQQVSTSHGTSARSDDNAVHFGGSVGQSKSATEVEMIPADLFGRLPNLQFFAFVAGGRVYKGRLPIVEG